MKNRGKPLEQILERLTVGVLWLCIVCSVAFAAATIMGCHAKSAPENRDAGRGDRMYRWLTSHQSPSGLVANQEGDDLCGMYSAALAAICYMHQGDMDRAERIFAAFEAHFVMEFEPPGGFHQFWSVSSGAPLPHTDRWVGDNAWLLIALNRYEQETGNRRFAHMREGIAQWLIGLQDTDGGIFSGYTTNGAMNAKSTEANLDCYAALVDSPVVRQRVLDWLREKMWVPGETRFKMGSTVSESALDGSSWSVAALGPAYATTLQYAERRFSRKDSSIATGAALDGFSDFADKPRIWLEGTGQMIVAYQVAGQHERAQYYLTEMGKALIESELFPGTAGFACFTSHPEWEGAASRIFVPSQAWALFAEWNFNPMSGILID